MNKISFNNVNHNITSSQHHQFHVKVSGGKVVKNDGQQIQVTELSK